MNMPTHGRILVVDDNDATRYSTSRILRAAKFEVVEAASGSEAMARVGDAIDLVVLDVNLPDFDGFEVCRRIRQIPQIARMPVVHLSATFTKPEDYVQGLESGADGYLTHPVEPIVLIGTVNAFLRTRDAEESLRASEARFRAVFDRAQVAMILVGEGSRFLEVNPAFCDMVGYARDELVGHSTAIVLGDRAAAAAPAIVAQIERTGEWRGELPMRHRDGHDVEVEWTTTIHSAPAVRLSVGVDITQRRVLEREREALLASEQAARGEAERANRLKDDFLATLSHELRNPLNAILGWSQVLRRRREADGDLVKGLDTIDRNARLQAQLIEDLLDVSRITSGKLRLDALPIDPEAVVDAALEVVRPAAEARETRLVTTLARLDLRVLGDEARLQQVIWNLLSNAIKFSAKGGKVHVETRRVDSSFELVIADDGIGIAPDFLPHIFERFRQQDAGSRRSHSGLGLGLAIVKHLVEMHGGTIFAASEGVGRGARFTLRLPLSGLKASSPANGAPDAVGDAGASAPDRLAGLRIVLAEDDDDAREIVLRMLAEAGADAVGAANADEAIALIAAGGVDVLVSDIGMPGRNGYDLIRALRADGIGAQRLPAIALTAFARMEDRRDALIAGYQMHLAKPVDAQELLAAIVAVSVRAPG